MQITNIRVGEAMTSEYGAVLLFTLEKRLMSLQNHWKKCWCWMTKRLHGLVTKESLMRSLSNGVSPSLPIRRSVRTSLLPAGMKNWLAGMSC